ncbi:MAG: hypothetical protein ACREI8_09970 [Myxococcota bacterium]
MPPEPRLPRRSTVFKPRFTIVLLYVAGFFLLYAMLFALPDLVAGARELGPGPEELTSEEMARAQQIASNALAGGKVLIALVASLATVGIGIWRDVLPGVR